MKKNTYNTTTTRGGVGVLTVVQIVFIILKLVGTINWPWTTVLIPLWIQLGITAFVLLLWLLVAMFHQWRKK
jgi:hypothetical protein